MNACPLPAHRAQRYQLEHCGERFETPSAEVKGIGFAVCPS